VRADVHSGELCGKTGLAAPDQKPVLAQLIKRCAPAAGDFPSMGELLAQRRREEMYTVGFYMGHGMANNGAPNPTQVFAPPPDTVEGVLANGGMKYAFVDFSKAAPAASTSWFTAENTVREFGVWPKRIVPARSFDAIFYTDAVTPSILVTRSAMLCIHCVQVSSSFL